MPNKVEKILEVKNLRASIQEESGDNKEILNGLSMDVIKGKVHVIMGPNGSGKSTLAQVLMGNPSFNVDSGEVIYDGEDLLGLAPNERALKGVFLSFQYPSEIAGVSITNYLRMIYNKKTGQKLTPSKFRKLLQEKLELLDMKEDLINRYLNEGFSGGEKKRMEMLQMLLLEPKLVILDEVDSGLDIDALQIISKAVNKLKTENDATVLLITHYNRILKYVEADQVHIMQHGKIVREGGKELALELEEKGYTNL